MMGEILVGIALLYIYLYFITIPILLKHCLTVKTNSKGIKQLRFQEGNHAWNKFVFPIYKFK